MFEEEEIDFVTLKWSAFSNTWKAFERRNGGPDSLKEFAFLLKTIQIYLGRLQGDELNFF